MGKSQIYPKWKMSDSKCVLYNGHSYDILEKGQLQGTERNQFLPEVKAGFRGCL